MRILRIIGAIVAVLALAVGITWLLRSDPMGPISGRALSGEEAPYPIDWGFSNEHMLIAVETRPEDPHSVTTICLLVDGQLYVPAQDGSEKQWPQYVLEDPRVRLKIGDVVYPARAVRVEPDDLDPFLAAGREKYADMMGERDELPGGIWLFRIERRLTR